LLVVAASAIRFHGADEIRVHREYEQRVGRSADHCSGGRRSIHERRRGRANRPFMGRSVLEAAGRL